MLVRKRMMEIPGANNFRGNGAGPLFVADIEDRSVLLELKRYSLKLDGRYNLLVGPWQDGRYP